MHPTRLAVWLGFEVDATLRQIRVLVSYSAALRDDISVLLGTGSGAWGGWGCRAWSGGCSGRCSVCV